MPRPFIVPSTLLRVYGPLGIARRVRYETEVRLGVARRRTPPRAELPPDPGGEARLGLLDLNEVDAGYRALPDAEAVRRRAVADAERVLVGELAFYGARQMTVGWPPAWRRNPETGYEHPGAMHWSGVADHEVEAGDLKDVWEPSRFAWAYTLLRAFAVTGERRYPEAFWAALEDWVADNPPNCGPNWSCGQEAAIRATAVLFAIRALWGNPTMTPQRLSVARRLLRATGQRVAATIGYAASQRNNHIISEAACLYVLGTVFPSWPEAPRWRRSGWRHLRTAIRDQFYADGAYAQHSVTYQRFAVQTLCWVLAASRETGTRVPDGLAEAVRRSVRLLHAVQDEASGHLPNLGANDGAMLLALSTCDFRDFRPTLQTAALLVDDAPLYGAGPWDEEALWLLGPHALAGHAANSTAVDPRPGRLVATEGGLLATRGPSCMALLRVSPQWRHRPAQADDCHVDVWLDGTEVGADAGTYRYTAPPPWGNGLAASRVHNTATIEGGDRLRRIGRFLSTDWPRTRILLDASGEDWQCWIVESIVPVWRPLGGKHRRLLLRYADYVLVGDLMRADAPNHPQLSWNLPASGEFHHHDTGCQAAGESWRVDVAVPPGAACQETVAGDGLDGWQAPTYALLCARRTVTVTCSPAGECVIVSLFDRQRVYAEAATLRPRVREVLVECTEAQAHQLVAALARNPGSRSRVIGR